MKKVFLTLATFGLLFLTSCGGGTAEAPVAEEPTQTEQTEAPNAEETNAAESQTSSIDVPQFEDANIQAFADNYAQLFKDMVSASETGDDAKLEELTAKAKVEIERVAKDFGQSPEIAKLTTWMEGLAQQ